MIAPIDKSVGETGGKARTLHSARRVAASVLLSAKISNDRTARPISTWCAWLFAAWAVIVTTVYFAYMLGIVD